METRYLNGPAGQLVDAVLMRESAAGSVAWYLPDRLGTVRDLINNAGAIIDHVDFSAFGTVLAETNPTVGDRMMGFARLVRDSVTGLNLAVHRALDPTAARWTGQDPKQFAAADANLYRYVANSPTVSSDPSGFGKTGLIPSPPQSSIKLTDSQCNSYPVTDGKSLVKALHDIHNKGLMIADLFIKGHGNDGNLMIQLGDGNNTDVLTITKKGIMISTGKNGVDVTKLMRDVTGPGTTIFLAGCETNSLAQGLSNLLQDDVLVRGYWLPSLGIPWTSWTMGWRVAYKNGWQTDPEQNHLHLEK